MLHLLGLTAELDVKARYVRLYVVSPTQGTGKDATRIYEFEVYGD